MKYGDKLRHALRALRSHKFSILNSQCLCKASAMPNLFEHCRAAAKLHSVAVILLAASLLQVSCIDEDLDDCPPAEKDFRVEYEVRLVTNMELELNTVLTTNTEIELAKRLRNELRNVFRNFAHDVDLSFYDLEDDRMRSHHETHIMDAEQASYALMLPVSNYLHLAVANIGEEPLVRLQDDHEAGLISLQQMRTDTIDSQQTGLFTARLPMIMTGLDQTFDVHLYMANCATSLVVDPGNVKVKGMEVYMTDLADNFGIRDSVYHFEERPAIVRAKQMEETGSDLLCWYAVHFPTRDYSDLPDEVIPEGAIPDGNKAQGRATLPAPEGGISRVYVNITTDNGVRTHYLFYTMAPMKASTLNILKFRLSDIGGLETMDPDIVVDTDYTWREGASYTPEM